MWVDELPDEVERDDNHAEWTDTDGRVYLHAQFVVFTLPVVVASVKWYKDGGVYKLGEPWKSLKEKRATKTQQWIPTCDGFMAPGGFTCQTEA